MNGFIGIAADFAARGRFVPTSSVTRFRHLVLAAVALACSLLLFSGSARAQDKAPQAATCVLEDMMAFRLFEDPSLAEVWRENRDHLEWHTGNFAWSKNAQATYTIPVVVHIVHDNGSENVPDSKVHEAIDQVNADFAASNATNIHPNFQGLVTPAQMEFRLAQCDPDGNPTSGITRTRNKSWSDCGGCDISMKQPLHWPTDSYLNVYVVKSSDGGNGSAFAYYPSQVTPPWEHYDGVVISSWALGRTTEGYYSILTHEIGHWANLIHTWGNEGTSDQASSCNQDDLVADTPNTIGHFQAGCGENTTSCGSLDNNENFMDYGYCAKMYTAGQVARMHAALNSSVASRNQIWSAANLDQTLNCGPSNDVVQLDKGTPVNGVAASQGEWRYFSIEVPAGASNLNMEISGGSGDADLYTRFGALPDESTYDCRPYRNGNAESCTVSAPNAGTYYLGLRAYNTFANVTVVADYGQGGGTIDEIHETNLAASQNQWLRYQVEVPAGVSRVTFSISGGTGDADLYLRLGSAPQTDQWDHRPWVNGNQEEVVLDNPAPGTWHIGIRAYNTFSGLNLDVTAP